MTNGQVAPEITFGGEICKKLQKLYYPNQKWGDKISNKVAKLFSQLKKEARTFFSESSEVDMLRKISRFTDEEFKELCEVSKIQKETAQG